MVASVSLKPMKTLRYSLAFVLGVAAITGLRAANPSADSRVTVEFSDPDKFTDAADGQRGSDYGRDKNLEELKDYIVQRATKMLPEGQKLAVTITDVDLAGEVEPWRSPSAQDIRIIKDIYAPRIQLSFKLTDANGTVIKEGKRTLSDLSYTMKLRVDRSDPRVYDKGLLDDWLRSEFGRAKK